MSDDLTATAAHPTRTGPILPAAHLEAWAGHNWTDGVQVDALRNLESLVVRTRNSLYAITLIDAGAGIALVQGGAFFPVAARVTIMGSSLGGAFLKLRGIYCGFSLEMCAEGTRIVTSRVESVAVAADAPGDAQ